MLHIFISNRFDDMHPATTGRPVAGYEARIVDEDMVELVPGTIGRLAVRGPPDAAISPTTGSATMSVKAGT